MLGAGADVGGEAAVGEEYVTLVCPAGLEADREVRVTLADGREFDVEVPPGEIAARLAAIASERRGDQVFLRADQGLAYGRIVEVMAALSAGGFRSISLVTDPSPQAN